MAKRAKREKRKSRSCKNILKTLLIILFLISVIILGINLISRFKTNNDDEEIRNMLSEQNEDNKSDNEKKAERIAKLEELQKINSDIVALIEIKDSNINYPVLQCGDNDFYMTHNYKKKESKDGALFLDKDYDWNIPSTNLLIYGHNNVGSKEMFVDLMNYKEESYYNTHKTIRFTTNKEDAEYEIISVFLSRVYYKSEKDVFRYYFFINANNEEEFNDYVTNSKNASLYNIEATAKYGDQLLTLSTCEYSQEDGRLAVVARKINSEGNN